MKSELLRIKLEEYIDENLADASFAGLARFLGYSPVYTCSFVKRLTGEPNKKFLHRKKPDLSAALLLNPEIKKKAL